MLRKIKIYRLWNRIGFVLTLFVLALMLFGLIIILGGQGASQANPVSLKPQVCELENKPHTKPVFRVYYPTNLRSPALTLCEEIKNILSGTDEYSAVEVTYYLGESDKTMQLQKGIFNLFLIKLKFEQSLPKDIDIKHIALASYSGYGVYLISKNDIPKLDGSYLSGKSLGLIANRFSESGYKYPRKVIFNSVSKEELPNFKSNYAKHSDLRAGLQKEEVDLISSYWDDALRKKYPEWNALKIADVPKGDTWYLKLDNNQSDITCKISKALKNTAQSQNNEYWKNINIHSACDEVYE